MVVTDVPCGAVTDVVTDVSRGFQLELRHTLIFGIAPVPSHEEQLAEAVQPGPRQAAGPP